MWIQDLSESLRIAGRMEGVGGQGVKASFHQEGSG